MEKMPVKHIHEILKEPKLSGSFSIRDVQEMLSGKAMVQELHRHDFFYILVVAHGGGQHDIDFHLHPVTDQSVFIMRPGQVHQITLDANSTGYLMQFKDEFYLPKDKTSKQLLHNASRCNLYQFPPAKFQKLMLTLDNIFQEDTSLQDEHYEAIRANMDLFFIELIRHSSKCAAMLGTSEDQELLEKFLDLMESNVGGGKGVSAYAAMLNLSNYQLNTMVKTRLGKTTSELINERTILEAKRLLLATSEQIYQIAHHLGYEDVSYFIRFFRKHTSYSPEAFRQNFK